MAQKEGLIALEKHIETPAESAIFSKYPEILAHKALISFMTDTFRMVIIGGIASHDLEALMEADIDTHHDDIEKPSVLLAKIGDALPGLGIVAAVLGIVITMRRSTGRRRNRQEGRGRPRRHLPRHPDVLRVHPAAGDEPGIAREKESRSSKCVKAGMSRSPGGSARSSAWSSPDASIPTRPSRVPRDGRRT